MKRRSRIVLRGLTCGYANESRLVPVLEDVSLSVEPGRVLCVIGINGSGKSTLISAAAGLTAPSAGTVTIELLETSLNTPPIVALLHQDYRQTNLPWASVLDNVVYPLGFRGAIASEHIDNARQLLAKLLPEVDPSRRIHTLSGGQQQLVAIGRALVSSPDAVLADEPLSAADWVHRTRAVRYLHAHWGQSATPIIWVSHDVDEALLLGDEIALLSKHQRGVARFLPAVSARPRDPSYLAVPEVVALKRTILEFLLEESGNAE